MATLLSVAAIGYDAARTSSNGYANPTMLMPPEQVAAYQRDPNWRLVDVRGPEQYAVGHTPGATNMMADRLTRQA